MILINKTKNTPEIRLEWKEDKALVEITGESWPENAPVSYRALFDFIEDSLKDDKIKLIKLTFSLNYYNTSSTKVFIALIDLLNSIFAKGKDVKIIWEIPNKDSDLISEAEDLLESALFGCDIRN